MSPVRRARSARVMTSVTSVALIALTGCTGDASSTPRPTPTTQAVDRGSTLSDLDTAALVVRRAPFCDLVDPAAVSRALGQEPTDVSAHRSGQRTRLGDGTGQDVTDVVHEFGCTWTAGGSRAEAWVFVPPVTRDRARTLVDLAGRTAGCTELSDAPTYGDPSVATSCRLDAGIQVSYRGLFGDAWLACTLTTPGGQQEELTDRAGRWCAAVATGAASLG